MDFVRILQEELVRAGVLPEDGSFDGLCEPAPAQPGDMFMTCADTDSLERDYGFRPTTDIRDGLRRFASP